VALAFRQDGQLGFAATNQRISTTRGKYFTIACVQEVARWYYRTAVPAYHIQRSGSHESHAGEEAVRLASQSWRIPGSPLVLPLLSCARTRNGYEWM